MKEQYNERKGNMNSCRYKAAVWHTATASTNSTKLYKTIVPKYSFKRHC